jgi:hypothetical protein
VTRPNCHSAWPASAPYRFLAALLFGVYELETEILSSRDDWSPVIDVAAQELVLPALFPRLRELGLLGRVSSEVAEFLEATHAFSCQRNREIRKELRYVVQILNGAGLTPILLKGAAFLELDIYEDQGSRYIADIDLLLPFDQVQEAHKLLQDAGFEVDRKDRFGDAKHHAPPLLRPGKVGVELHRSLGGKAVERLLPAEVVIREASPVQSDLGLVRIPTPEHLLTHLILHSQLHHPYPERIWPPLRALYDLVLVQRFYGASVSWNNLEAWWTERNQRAVYSTHLRQATAVTGVAFPAGPPTTSERIRLWHRRVLWRFPSLRFGDPIFLFQTLLRPRWNILKLAQRQRGLWGLIARAPFRVYFYRRLWTDLLERR